MTDAVDIDTRGLEIKTYPSGTTVFASGEPGDCAYLVAKGAVAIVTVNDKGERVTAAMIKTGEIFGEMAIVNRTPRTTTAIAAQDCTCVVIDRSILEKRLAKTDPFIRFWIEYMSERLQALTKRAHT
ncbi:MAG: Crp/Fnr family transcriptional regulator [Rhodospirillaceae bacterium]|nr:Crp/Fnr family transcriptional regulator [Rhodospirillaceae bacterium]